MVPVDQMCEPNSAVSDNVIDDGITEEMDRALAERTPRHSVQSWEQIWQLLFPQDISVLDSGESPIVSLHNLCNHVGS